MTKLNGLVRFNLVLLAGILICIVLFYARQILVLLSFGILLSMLMNPLANRLEEKGMGRVWSTILCIFIVLFVVLVILAVVSTQIYNISQQIPQIQEKFEKYTHLIQIYILKKFEIAPREQMIMIKKQLSKFGESSFIYLRDSFVGTLEILGYFVMVLVLMFLFLFQREKYKVFFIKIYKRNNPEESELVADKIVNIAHGYLVGMLMSMGILTVLYSIGFLIIGLKNAILLAAIAASLIIIPYIGTLTGGLIAFVMALLTEQSITPALGVLVVLGVIQTIDNNVIEPVVVGGQIKLSAIATIIALFGGGILWGMPGVVLFLPLIGILKVIFDHTESLQPYGYLIGDQETKTPSSQVANWIKKIFGKK